MCKGWKAVSIIFKECPVEEAKAERGKKYRQKLAMKQTKYSLNDAFPRSCQENSQAQERS